MGVGMVAMLEVRYHRAGASELTMHTAYMTHPSSMLHEMGSWHPECPERLAAITDRLLTEGLLNHIEVAIRAFDPCLSCATHAVGQMPLAVELIAAEGGVIDRLLKGAEAARC